MSFSKIFNEEKSKIFKEEKSSLIPQKTVNSVYSSSGGSQNFPSDEEEDDEENIEVSVIFLKKPEGSALLEQDENESPAKLIGQNKNGFYWLSPDKAAASKAKKEEGNGSWKSECNCAIL